LRIQALNRPIAAFWTLILTVLLAWPGAAEAAEVLQVRTATLLQIGDRNRNYAIELACIAIDAADESAAMAWLRQELPRHTRVNLRPYGERQGLLLAKVSRLDGQQDLGAGLIAAGLAHPNASPAACQPAELS